MDAGKVPGARARFDPPATRMIHLCYWLIALVLIAGCEGAGSGGAPDDGGDKAGDPAAAARTLQGWGADWSANVVGARSDAFDTVVIITDLYPDAGAVASALAMCAALLGSPDALGPLRINGQGDVVIASRHTGSEPCESRL